MSLISKHEADAYDRMLDAAAELAELLQISEIPINDEDLEALTIFLAYHAETIRKILSPVKRIWPRQETLHRLQLTEPFARR